MSLYQQPFRNSQIRLHITSNYIEGDGGPRLPKIRTTDYLSAIKITSRLLRNESEALLVEKSSIRICSFQEIVSEGDLHAIPLKIRQAIRCLEIDFDMDHSSITTSFPSIETLVAKRDGFKSDADVMKIPSQEAYELVERYRIRWLCDKSFSYVPNVLREFEVTSTSSGKGQRETLWVTCSSVRHYTDGNSGFSD